MLEFVHPIIKDPLRLVAPIDHDMFALVERIGWVGALPPEWLVGTGI